MDLEVSYDRGNPNDGNGNGNGNDNAKATISLASKKESLRILRGRESTTTMQERGPDAPGGS